MPRSFLIVFWRKRHNIGSSYSNELRENNAWAQTPPQVSKRGSSLVYFRDLHFEMNQLNVWQMHPNLHHVPRGQSSTMPKIYVFRHMSALKVLCANLWIDIDRLSSSSSQLWNGWTGSEGGQGQTRPPRLDSSMDTSGFWDVVFQTFFFYPKCDLYLS